MSRSQLIIQPSELQVDPTAYDRIVEAILYSEQNQSDSPIGIGYVCGRSKENINDVKKVLYAFLHTGRLLPSFKAYCKNCGYLGDKAISVRQISESCPCCHNKIMPIIEFWAPDHRPSFTTGGDS